MIRIAHIDPHISFRQSLKAALPSDRVRMIADTSDWHTSWPILQALRPDIVLLELYLPEEDSMLAIKSIRSKLEYCHVAILTLIDERVAVLDSLKAGADGYMLKRSTDLDSLLKGLDDIQAGRAAIDPAVASYLVDAVAMRLQDRSELNVPDCGLTEREIQVLWKLGDGHSNKQIAHELNISRRTVQTHTSNIFEKLGVNSRTQAVLAGQQKGYIKRFSLRSSLEGGIVKSELGLSNNGSSD